MKKYSLPILVCLLLLFVFGLGACSTTDTAPQQPTEAEVADSPTVDSEPTDISVSEDANSSVDAGSEDDAVALVGENGNYCVDCHTDQQALVDTAKPEDEIISENEGEG